jgi:hypothetical protein
MTKSGHGTRARRGRWPLLASAAVAVALLFGGAVIVAEISNPRTVPSSIWLPPDFQDGDRPFVGSEGAARLEHWEVVRDSKRQISLRPRSEAARGARAALDWVRQHLGGAPAPVPEVRTLLDTSFAARQEWVDQATRELRRARDEALIAALIERIEDPKRRSDAPGGGWPSGGWLCGTSDERFPVSER